ncbi:unnamed protein product [Boreogadus saida]
MVQGPTGPLTGTGALPGPHGGPLTGTGASPGPHGATHWYWCFTRAPRGHSLVLVLHQGPTGPLTGHQGATHWYWCFTRAPQGHSLVLVLHQGTTGPLTQVLVIPGAQGEDAEGMTTGQPISVISH